MVHRVGLGLVRSRFHRRLTRFATMLIPALLLAMPCLQTPPIVDLPAIELGHWRAELESPGGALPFGLDVQSAKDGLAVWIVNGSERIQIPNVKLRAGMLTLDMDHYQSRITAKLDEDGRGLTGTWRKAGAKKQQTEMEFFAEWGDAPRFPADEEAIDPGQTRKLEGRWLVRFSSSEEPAVGVFSAGKDGRATGTFLTSLGDYRFLAGSFRSGRLRLSCFDGAHAFLFDALMSEAGYLRGDFWSRDTWHESWSAELNSEAKLSDPFGLSVWNDKVSVDSLSFFNPDTMEMASLGDKEFAGPVRLIQLFGTWCPNCHDEAPFLSELWRTYHDQGLQIVGLAFEHSASKKIAITQIRRFSEKHAIPYPVLVGGTSDKKEATDSFRGLKEVIAYPTVLFVDSTGRVRKIHTGFTGPAAGALHEREKERFHELIRDLLEEAASKKR